MDKVDFLEADDGVVGVAFGSDARSYPIRLLNRHEIIKDTIGPVSGGDDPRLRKKEAVIGVRIGGATRAYPVARIASAPNGRIEDRFGGGTIILEAENKGRIVRIVDLPQEVQVVHTFWFAWNAFHPQTSIFGSGRGSTNDRH